MIDLHCHILPGVDDGVRTLEDAVEMARVAVAQGVRKIVATPHVFRDNLNWGDIAGLDEKRSQLVDEIQKNGIQVEILPGAEVHIFHGLIAAVRKNRAHLVINQTSYMFVEFPAGHVFSGVKNLFFELMTEGITPIITHPERNAVFVQSPGRLYELIQMGALAQANSGSFLGLYGDKTEKAVLQFLKLNLIHLIGSDSHGPRSLSWRLRDAVAKAEIVVSKEQAQALVEENPQAVVDNKELPFLLQAINPKKRERPFSIRIPKIFKGRH
jgi:protein-tyrosine phosphatase